MFAVSIYYKHDQIKQQHTKKDTAKSRMLIVHLTKNVLTNAVIISYMKQNSSQYYLSETSIQQQ